ASMPQLFEIYDRFPEEKVAVIGVHVGIEGDGEVNTVEKLDAALVETRKELWKGRDLPFPVALVKAEKSKYSSGEDMADSQAAADYGIGGYPTAILIDPEGRVIDLAESYLDSDDNFEKLAKLLGVRPKAASQDLDEPAQIRAQ